MIAEMSLELPDNCLAVFVDDTGHEALIKDHPVYGLGGCATLVRDLDRYLRDPWREVRRLVTGSRDTPLHANTFPGIASHDDILTVAKFFRSYPFGRLGTVVSFKTKLADDLSSIPTVAAVLQQRIREIAGWTDFELGRRRLRILGTGRQLVEAAFQGFGLEKDGEALPVECYFMRKEHAEPGLEVADFIMHAVGRQARQNLKQRGVFVPDFQAVFHTVDRKLTSFMEVDAVTRNDS